MGTKVRSILSLRKMGLIPSIVLDTKLKDDISGETFYGLLFSD